MLLIKNSEEYYITKIQCRLRCTTYKAIQLYHEAEQLSNDKSIVLSSAVEYIIDSEKKRW